MIGRDKKSIISFIKERIWKKIQSWNSRSLSRTGKEVLIKSVAQAIPSHCMSAFLLPTTLGEESAWWILSINGARRKWRMRYQLVEMRQNDGKQR
jgi:hypothetical protein